MLGNFFKLLWVISYAIQEKFFKNYKLLILRKTYYTYSIRRFIYSIIRYYIRKPNHIKFPLTCQLSHVKSILTASQIITYQINLLNYPTSPRKAGNIIYCRASTYSSSDKFACMPFKWHALRKWWTRSCTLATCTFNFGPFILKN